MGIFSDLYFENFVSVLQRFVVSLVWMDFNIYDLVRAAIRVQV